MEWTLTGFRLRFVDYTNWNFFALLDRNFVCCVGLALLVVLFLLVLLGILVFVLNLFQLLFGLLVVPCFVLLLS